MGARAAVIAATEMLADAEGEVSARLILASYPLVSPKGDLRDEILVQLPAHVQVLFVVGERDEMCPLEKLEDVRKRMQAPSDLLVVRGAGHGMGIKGTGKDGEREVGEAAGLRAAIWAGKGRLEGEIGGRKYIGVEEEEE